MKAYPLHNNSGQCQHANPKSRLKYWEAESPGQIWCYAKERDAGRRVCRQMLAKATVVRGVWSENDEGRLNTEIEQAAEPGLLQLSHASTPVLEGEQREAVSRYLVSLFRRGWNELTAQPMRLKAAVERLEVLIDAQGFSPVPRHVLETELAELAMHPPGRPFPLPEAAQVLAAMRWTVLDTPHHEFVNTDSPVQIVPPVIVGQDCEVTMTLTPKRALVCDWGIPQPWTETKAASSEEILEVNCRAVRGARDCIYFASRPEEGDVPAMMSIPARRRIHDWGSGRKVPWRHRVTMDLAAKRILAGREKEDNALVERLVDLATRNDLMVREEDLSA